MNDNLHIYYFSVMIQIESLIDENMLYGPY